MKHNLTVDGYLYRLRPVEIEDAAFIVETRLEDAQRNQYIHPISPDIAPQIEWIKKYHGTPDDYYFVVENKLTGRPEGLIAVYNIRNGSGEWGRWVMKKDSLASPESFYLICKAAFESLNLESIYSRTIEENKTVVAFHDSVGAKRRGVLSACFTLNGKVYDAVEHIVERDYFFTDIAPRLEKTVQSVFERFRRVTGGGGKFHHIGIAAQNIEKEYECFKMLGYTKEGELFIDEAQGIRGQFIIAQAQPRLELLENLEGRRTLDRWLHRTIKIYHFAYCVRDFDTSLRYFLDKKAKIISPEQKSAYFGKRICFIVLPDMFMIELIEE